MIKTKGVGGEGARGRGESPVQKWLPARSFQDQARHELTEMILFFGGIPARSDARRCPPFLHRPWSGRLTRGSILLHFPRIPLPETARHYTRYIGAPGAPNWTGHVPNRQGEPFLSDGPLLDRAD